MDQCEDGRGCVSGEVVLGNAVCQVTKVIRRLPGGSQSLLVAADDGNFYVVKLKGNPQGTTVLFNELVSSRIARLLGLSVPDFQLARIGDPISKGLYFETETGRHPVPTGLHFASRVVMCPLQGRIYEAFPQKWSPLIRNPEMLVGSAVFHRWLRNLDTPQFLYWRFSREKKFTITVIDHGHCLGGPKWRGGLRPEMYTLLRYSRSDLAFWHDKLANISREALLGVFENIPQEWGCSEAARIRGLASDVLDWRERVLGYLRVYAGRSNLSLVTGSSAIASA